MDEDDITEWNQRIEEIKALIKKNCPRGCAGFNETDCDRCILDHEGRGTKWNYLCDLMNDLSSRE